jgi:adenylyl- and sulfurtransferase ThiI
MADNDKKLSEKIIRTADALQNWDLVKPYAKEVTSLIKEYSEIIDGVGSVFSVVGFVWSIYSNMEKAKDTAAEQQAMVEQITQAGTFRILCDCNIF